METRTLKNYLYSDWTIISVFFIAKILFHLLHPEYGYFRDELFYIAIADNFSFSNLDVLPLTPLYLKLITTLFGYALKVIHFASALCGAISIVMACLITRELGGRKYAILFTGLTVFFSGFIIFGGLFTYDSLDFLIWVTSIYILVRIINRDQQKLWLLFGLITGLGFLNKLTISFFGLAIAVGLLLSSHRIVFKKKWIWIGAGISVVFTIPFLIWQFQQDWYFIGVAAGYAGGISYIASFPEFIWNQLLPNNLFNFPLWITGLLLLLFSSRWKTYRFFGYGYFLLFFMFYFAGAKFYFLVPYYTILLAVGSIKLEEFINNQATQKAGLKILKPLLPVLYVLLSMPPLPLALPLLPVQDYINYINLIGGDTGVRTESHEIGILPQHFADRFGWEEMVAQVAAIYDTVNHSEGEFGIVTENWGQAGAIHFFGKKYGLPEPASTHGWYYFETLRSHQIKENYIAMGIFPGTLENLFEEVTIAAVITHPYSIPHEKNRPIAICRGAKVNLKQYWVVERRVDPQFDIIRRAQGVQAAINYYLDQKRIDPRTVLFSERQINTLGYEYLRSSQINDAIALFQLNVEAYPKSSNVYDSLAEGYMENEQYDLAVKFYNLSIEINPENDNGKQQLEKIYRLMQK